MTTKQNKQKNLGRVSPRIVYRLFNPQVPVVICSKFRNEIAAMPANSCSSASESPPMISVAVRIGTRTNHVIQECSRFSVNWMNFEPKHSRKTILELASPSPHDLNYDKLKQHNIPYFMLQRTPVLEQACAFAVCKVNKQIRTGDHDLFIADVVCAMAPRDFTAYGYWRFKRYKPILYLGSIRRDPLVTI